MNAPPAITAVPAPPAIAMGTTLTSSSEVVSVTRESVGDSLGVTGVSGVGVDVGAGVGVAVVASGVGVAEGSSDTTVIVAETV